MADTLVGLWIVGLCLVVTGIALVHVPSALVVAGAVLMGWSTWRLR